MSLKTFIEFKKILKIILSFQQIKHGYFNSEYKIYI